MFICREGVGVGMGMWVWVAFLKSVGGVEVVEVD